MTKHNKATPFYEAVTEMVAGGSTVMDSVLEYCNRNSLEVEAVVPLVTKNAKLLSLLRDEAESVNAIERVAHLPGV